jgi:Na+/proline symporter
MDSNTGNIVIGSVMVYMVACVGVGLWAMRRTKSTHDFFMAGRNLGIFVTAFAMFSSVLSGFGFVGGPGLVYLMGMSSVWMVVVAIFGTSFSGFLISKRLRLIAELQDSISLPDAIAARYNSELSRFLSALAIILGVIGYLGTQILAMGTVLRDIVVSHPSLPNQIPLELAIAVSCTVLVFYCVTGGIIAGVYTDLFQGAIMMVAGVLVFMTALGAVDGGMTGISETIGRDDPEAISPWGTLGMLGCISWFFLFAFGASGQPHVITKTMMVKDVRDAKYINPISGGAYVLAALLWIGIGLAMRALVIQGVHEPLISPDDAAPQFLLHYAPPLLAGIVFAGLFAAIMSTADSFLSIGAAAWVHDIPKALLGRSLKRELLWARVATVVLVIVSALFALYTSDLVALLGAFGWGTFAAALVPHQWRTQRSFEGSDII